MRKIADCRLFPSESQCSLTIGGTEDEVLRAAAEHAASVHGHDDTQELREQLRTMLADEGPAGRYGSVMIATLTGSLDQLRRATVDWVEHGAAAGFLAEEVLLADDGSTVVVPVFFASKQDDERLAEDPVRTRGGRSRWPRTSATSAEATGRGRRPCPASRPCDVTPAPGPLSADSGPTS